MANHKSAKKRAKQNEIKRVRNNSVKTRIKNIVKEVRLAIDENSKEQADIKLKNAKSVIAKAAKKGVIHGNTASRKISRLSKHVNALSA